LAQSSVAWAIDSIANPHLNNDLGAIIAFPGETFGLILRKKSMQTARYQQV
jgi:hypothetical protein